MEVSGPIYAWLQEIGIVKGGSGDGSRVKLAKSVSTQFESGVAFDRIFLYLADSGFSVDTPAAALKEARGKDGYLPGVDLLNNWNLLVPCFASVRVNVDPDVKDMIVGGDLEAIQDLLEETFAAVTLTQPSAPTSSKSRVQPVDDEGDDYAAMPLSGSMRGAEKDDLPNHLPKDYSRVAVNLKKLENEKDANAAEDVLEFFIITVHTKLGMKIKNAVNALTANPERLGELIIGGVKKGGFRPVIKWFQDLFSLSKKLLDLLKTRPKDLLFILSTLQEGFRSRSYDVALWTCRIFSRLGFSLGKSRMADDNWEWFVGSGSGLDLLVECFTRHHDIKLALFAVFDHFGRAHYKEVFEVHLRNKLSEAHRYLAFVHEFLEPLASHEEARAAMLKTGSFDYLLDQAVASAGPENKLAERVTAVGLAAEMWRLFPDQVDGKKDQVILALLKKACRDSSAQLQVSAHSYLFLLLDFFVGNPDSKHTLTIYKAIVFSLIDNYRNTSVRQFVLSNLSLTLTTHATLPLNLLVEPLLKQLAANECAMEDFDLFLILAKHPLMEGELAVSFMEFLGARCIDDTLFGRVASIPFLILANRYHKDSAVQSFVAEFTQTSLAFFVSKSAPNVLPPGALAEQNKAKRPTPQRMETEEWKRRKILVLEIIAKIVHLFHDDINAVVRPVVMTFVAKNRTEMGLHSLLQFFEDADKELSQPLEDDRASKMYKQHTRATAAKLLGNEGPAALEESRASPTRRGAPRGPSPERDRELRDKLPPINNGRTSPHGQSQALPPVRSGAPSGAVSERSESPVEDSYPVARWEELPRRKPTKLPIAFPKDLADKIVRDIEAAKVKREEADERKRQEEEQQRCKADKALAMSPLPPDYYHQQTEFHRGRKRARAYNEAWAGSEIPEADDLLPSETAAMYILAGIFYEATDGGLLFGPPKDGKKALRQADIERHYRPRGPDSVKTTMQEIEEREKERAQQEEKRERRYHRLQAQIAARKEDVEEFKARKQKEKEDAAALAAQQKAMKAERDANRRENRFTVTQDTRNKIDEYKAHLAQEKADKARMKAAEEEAKKQKEKARADVWHNAQKQRLLEAKEKKEQEAAVKAEEEAQEAANKALAAQKLAEKEAAKRLAEKQALEEYKKKKLEEQETADRSAAETAKVQAREKRQETREALARRKIAAEAAKSRLAERRNEEESAKREAEQTARAEAAEKQRRQDLERKKRLSAAAQKMGDSKDKSGSKTPGTARSVSFAGDAIFDAYNSIGESATPHQETPSARPALKSAAKGGAGAYGGARPPVRQEPDDPVDEQEEEQPVEKKAVAPSWMKSPAPAPAPAPAPVAARAPAPAPLQAPAAVAAAKRKPTLEDLDMPARAPEPAKPRKEPSAVAVKETPKPDLQRAPSKKDMKKEADDDMKDSDPELARRESRLDASLRSSRKGREPKTPKTPGTGRSSAREAAGPLDEKVRAGLAAMEKANLRPAQLYDAANAVKTAMVEIQEALEEKERETTDEAMSEKLLQMIEELEDAADDIDTIATQVYAGDGLDEEGIENLLEVQKKARRVATKGVQLLAA